MRVLMYSRTPLAAAPWSIWRALRKYTDIKVDLVNERDRYRDGRIFPHHLMLHDLNGNASRLFRQADIIHFHNYLPGTFPGRTRGQKILAQFHSLPRLGNWEALWSAADIHYTIDQPGQIAEYKIPGLPNIIDPDELRPIRREPKIRIGFAPTSRTHIGRPDSKAYHEVVKILDRIKGARDVDVDLIEGVPYFDNLRRKQRCHILIDDIVTGNWHRTSLEGFCIGAAVLARVNKIPFCFTTPRTLEDRLISLIDDQVTLEDFQRRGREWILKKWHPIEKIQEYIRAYEAAGEL